MVTVESIWTDPQQLIHDMNIGSPVRPAFCEYNGRAFLAWATYPDYGQDHAPSWSYCSRTLADDAWAAPKTVIFDDNSKQQKYNSALVVFDHVLYALVPFESPKSSGLAIYYYDGTTFQSCSSWSSVWNTDIAAVVAERRMHVIGRRLSDNQIIWTYSLDSLHNFSKTPELPAGQFSANLSIGSGFLTTSSVGLTARGNKVVAVILLFFWGRVKEITLDMTQNPPVWSLTDALAQSGDSGVSVVTTPDNQHSYICFKKHGGDSNLVCKYRYNDKCYDDNESLGAYKPASCCDVAVLGWSNHQMYAVWNAQLDGSPLYFRTKRLQSQPSAEERIVGMGYLPDKPSPTDPRIDMSLMPNMKLPLPTSRDLSNPQWVLNQSQIGSCTANAVAAAYRYELKRQNKPDFMVSRLYLYYTARLGMKHNYTASDYNNLSQNPPTEPMCNDTGSGIIPAVKVLGCIGAVSEDTWPYVWAFVDRPVRRQQSQDGTVAEFIAPGKLTFPSTVEAAAPPFDGYCFKLAHEHFTARYALAMQDKDCWKRCIAAGYTIIFGFNMSKAVKTWLGKTWQKTRDQDAVLLVSKLTEDQTGEGHAVLAVGFDDNMPVPGGNMSGCFKVQNSWGTDFGKDGFFWIPYDALSESGFILANSNVTLIGSSDH